MGPGGSQDAPFDLQADVPAGTYHLVCDGIIVGAVDVTFTLIWRRGDSDTELAAHTQHFEPLADGYDAQPCEVDLAATAIDFADGDQLVLRYAASNTTTMQAYIPNGDGANAHGRIPNLTLP